MKAINVDAENLLIDTMVRNPELRARIQAKIIAIEDEEEAKEWRDLPEPPPPPPAPKPALRGDDGDPIIGQGVDDPVFGLKLRPRSTTSATHSVHASDAVGTYRVDCADCQALAAAAITDATSELAMGQCWRLRDASVIPARVYYFAEEDLARDVWHTYGGVLETNLQTNWVRSRAL